MTRNYKEFLNTYSDDRKNIMIDVLKPNRRNKWLGYLFTCFYFSAT